ncbi:hypothetical protein [Deinococcus roseus]|uniref:DUF4926 domain-containing protein n=1 Tax=Deinococcus roseus TaxID=392414 RepID=A0ABQ2CY69_9DEIO|nr:hypothetical protein [Deinococcus roseus]GGJ25911.1 hypothetical protein GCM10008938_10060 [Deinococcus roseus]
MDLKSRFETFAQKGERHTLDLKTGEHIEGYILEVFEDHLLFGLGGPMAPDQPLQVFLDQVDVQTLWCWDAAAGKYVRPEFKQHS